ncbi:AAA-ATPase [Arthrobacter phage Vibaki]|uniref:AAA-ATPase n=1 Tax=Arthrobacter phage Vibaki TaxID=2593333 RepID=A0A514TZ02_9CAUD|nr:AAA-ATPase [Arthrobacter phage Vibaki]QDK01929.1 AAA-ATPase [Arthrobacter phage Vibaki]
MTRIIKLEATNFKRLRAVEITPAGDLVVISGRNGQGKTSVLDAITAALGGTSTKALPRPIREGASNAEIVIETDDLTITRRFTASGSTLTVVGKDGLKVPKGQARLDTLLGRLSLDPLAFTQLDDKQQLKTLLDLVELPFDPAELDQQRAAIFEDRTDVNRELKALTAQQAAFAVFPTDVPTEEVSVNDLLTKLEAARALDRDYEAAARQHAEAVDRVDRLRAELADAERGLKAAAEQLAEWDGHVLNEAALLLDQIHNAETINAQAREYAAYQRLQQRIADVKTSADLLTEQIETIDQRKRDGLAAAKFPGGLPLGFDETGVLLNGIPFKQASGAEQLRASLAMAIALNPALRVIRIADGSLLDSEGLQMVADMAAKNDCQVWIEVVSDGDGDGFMIEDGEVLDPGFF